MSNLWEKPVPSAVVQAREALAKCDERSADPVVQKRRKRRALRDKPMPGRVVDETEDWMLDAPPRGEDRGENDHLMLERIGGFPDGD